ncbi:MAG: 3-oxoacyl-[acyl-carrier-protein] reductase [Gemmatimonadetes bacterium]|nr:3-oxoacyl-[acyl-carrier-protein] reductase [Gemmatimonadota bacterium]
MTELDDQVAIVTGGTRGIGRAIAEELADGGAKIAVVATTAEGAARVAELLPGAGHAGFGVDVSDAAACTGLVSAVEEALGPPEILVNNAGITRDNILPRMKDEEWQGVLDTNLSGAFYVMRAAARGMMKRRSGKIVNVSSIVGLTGNRGQSNYAAAKAGLNALTKSVAQELAGRGVRANAVAPGFIETDMTDQLPEDVRDAMLDRIPLGRLGSPADVAKVVRFLVGPAGAYVTGQVIVVDGGMVM